MKGIHMKSFTRTLKYFTKLAEGYFLCLIVICLFLTAFMFLSADMEQELTDILYDVPGYFLSYSALLIIVINITLSYHVIPMVLSFNCTRKNIFIGLNWMFLLLAIQLLLVTAVYCMLLPNEVTGGIMKLLPFITGVMLSSIGISEFFGGISLRFGKLGLWIMMIFCMLIGACCGFLYDTPGKLSVVAIFLNLSSAASFSQLIYIVLAAGIFIYLAGAAGNYLLMRKSAVHV